MIEVRAVRKQFGEFVALRDVDLRVGKGELVALLGPSGSGKTTLLRVIAGLETPDSGSVAFGDGDATHISPRDRQVGFVFQHYALFRHMTVFENVAFGLRVKPRKQRLPEEQIRQKVCDLLRLVQLEAMESRAPSQLSGGQRQRVALARALAVDPKVLLLDEPFGSLDAKVRKDLRTWLRSLHRNLGFTCLFVTHDQEEALELADRVVVMNQGRIEQVGTPAEIYEQPANAFVYAFLGDVNLFHCRIKDGKAQVGSMNLELSSSEHSQASTATIFLRPHQIEVHHRPNGGPQFKARVKAINSARPLVRVDMITEWGEPLQVELSHERFAALQLSQGSEVFVSPTDARIFVQPDTVSRGGPTPINRETHVIRASASR
jgi:sulfate transport system ATP-binding protein